MVRLLAGVRTTMLAIIGLCGVGGVAAENIALNIEQSGYPHPLESDDGWGGGTSKWDLLDGVRTYPGEWARGLAFTGGDQDWGGEPAGPRQATIDFGTPQAFSQVILSHHGNQHVPAEAGLQYWNGSSWVDITFQRTVTADPNSSWSQPDTYDFAPVVGSKVRWTFDNSGMNILGEPITHGWLYEFEVYSNLPAVPGACCLRNGLCQVMPESSCALVSGVYEGDGTDCATTDCPPAPTGSILVWGMNDYGEYNVPPPNAGFVDITAGYHHSVALKPDGTIVAWGRNTDSNGAYLGQCDVPSPNADFVAIAGGDYHSLGLKADGSIVAWGLNGSGQCDVPAPNADFVGVFGGYLHSLGLKADGSLVAWGWNQYGQCDISEPNSVFVAAGGGTAHSLGLKADGSVAAWGHNDYQQCDLPSPNEGFVAIAVGGYFNLALTSGGTIVAWGGNDYGQCDVPPPNSDFVAIAAGYRHGLGLTRNGEIVCWGDTGFGNCNVPPPSMRYLAIASLGWHSLALKVIPDAGYFCHTSAWSTFDVKAGIGARGGYVGGVTDGRYVYLVPAHDGTTPHGEVVRYDTEAVFDVPSSWERFDAAAIASHVGYCGGAFDGRYVYFVPAEGPETEYHGEVLRFDTAGTFVDSNAWSTFDASTVGVNTTGYAGATFDGQRYLYFAPSYNGSGYHGEVLRYDTWADFTNRWSWQSYDPGAAGIGNDPDGYIGAVCDGRYVYFAPFKNGPEYHGEVLRYDSQMSFNDPFAWRTFDATAAPGSGGVGARGGYAGAVLDGHYVYFVPIFDGSTHHREVLRFDTTQDFASASSWAVFNANDVGFDTESFYGAAFDGRHVYFAPDLADAGAHGEVLRLDTSTPFTTGSSWSACAPAELGVGTNARGYCGVVARGRYLYFVPYANAVGHHGEVLRYDTYSGPAGDLDCDHYVTFADINPFVLALIDPSVYLERYPDCNIYLGDLDYDGFVSFSDINPFVDCLVSGVCP